MVSKQFLKCVLTAVIIKESKPAQSQMTAGMLFQTAEAKATKECWCYQDGRCQSSWICKSSKIQILNICQDWRANVHHPAKFSAARSSRCGDMAFFDFSRWRPSAILDSLYACLDHPRTVFGGLCHG